MNKLEWQQHNDLIFVQIPFEQKQITITIDNRLVKYLLAQTPKIFFIYVYHAKQKQEFLIDFSELKPTVQKKGKLKVTVKGNKENNKIQNYDEYYVIARGESFADRFLSPNGWLMQEYHFPLKETTQHKTPDRQTTKEPQLHLKTETPTAITTKKCPQCGSTVDISLDYCPLCFHKFITPSNNVDFSI